MRRASGSSPRRHAAVVLAGGRTAEQSDGPDVSLLPLAGRSLVSRALDSLTRGTDVAHVAVVVHRSDAAAAEGILAREVGHVSCELVPAGLSSQQSLAAALEALAEPILAGRYEMVLVHDATMPLVAPHLVRDVIKTAERWGAAVPYLGLDDYVWMDKMGSPLRFSGNNDRIRVQGPQAFRATDLLHAYRGSAAEGFLAGSATEAIERHCGLRVRGVPGDTRNVEVRSPRDLFAAEGLLATLNYVVS